MAVYRPVPAKILTVDYLGISTPRSETYIKRAEQELSKLEGQVLRGSLDQGHRTFNLGDNVVVECSVCFNLKQAVVVIGRGIETRLSEDECYCCSPCLVAGKIMSTKRADEEDVFLPMYEEEADYYAEILVCQAPSQDLPKKVTVYEERAAGGASVLQSRVLQNMTYDTATMFDVIYSDYQNHQVGDSVLVLVQPLYNFTPYAGEFLPCINQRKVADESVFLPEVSVTADYLESTGFSCQIAMDKALWGIPEEDPELVTPNKLYPFRVLPIKIESCL